MSATFIKRLMPLIAGSIVAVAGCRAGSPEVTFGASTVQSTYGALFWLLVGAFVLSAALTGALTFAFVAGFPNGALHGDARWWSLRWKRAWLAACGAGTLIFAGAVWSLFQRGFGDTVILFGGCVGVFAALGFAQAFRWRIMANWREDRRWDSIDSFVDLLGDPDPCVEAEAMSVLANRLPSEPMETIEGLSRPQRRTLYRYLTGSDVLLARAVVDIAERLGDCDALPFVERLIRSRQRDHRDDGLLAATRGCRDLLVQRRSESARADALLRPAAANRNPKELLVRAAESCKSESDLLLPSSAEGIDRAS